MTQAKAPTKKYTVLKGFCYSDKGGKPVTVRRSAEPVLLCKEALEVAKKAKAIK